MPERHLLAQENETLKRQLVERSRSLHETEACYDAVFNSALANMAICSVDGIVLDANRTALGINDLQIGDCVGKYLWETPWYDNHREEGAKVKAAIQARSGRITRYESRVRLPNDEWGVFETNIRPVRANVGGDVRFLVIEARDLTSVKASEERAHRAERMEALGLLTGGIAHDFNNFLTVVIGALDLVVRRPDKGNRDALIEAALEAAQKAEALNKQLLAFARRTPVAPQDTNVGATLQSLAPLLKKAVGEAVEVRVHVSGGPQTVRMDLAQFEAAALNLCVNARDAMPSGGVIDIEVRPATPQEAANLDVKAPAVTIAVKDTGVGIPADILPRVFDPFFTTKSMGGGAGLGLSQVYGFARRSGGAVDVASPAGHGAIFKLVLPCATATALASESAPDPWRALAFRTALLVEDDPSVASVTEAMLTELGLEVVTTSDGPEAQRLLERSAFDLLMTDVIMPGGMTGVQLAEWARRRRPEMKVLLFSGWAAEQMVGLQAGPGLLQKPFDLAALRRALVSID